ITVGTAGTVNPDESVTVTGNAVHDCYGTGIYIVSVGILTEFGNTITGAGNGLTIRDVTVASIGPSSVRLRDGVAGNALYLDGVTYSRIRPGGLSAPAGTGLRISSTCQHLTIGATAHIKAVAPVVNGGDSTVILAA